MKRNFFFFILFAFCGGSLHAQEAWSTLGNSNITGNKIFGTTDNSALNIHTFNQRRVTISPQGGVGIGNYPTGDYLSIRKHHFTTPISAWHGPFMFVKAFSDSAAEMLLASASSTIAHKTNIIGRKSRGRLSVPLSVATNDQIFSVTASPYNGTRFLNTANITLRVDAALRLNEVPTAITFHAGATDSPLERMRISSNGNVGINVTIPQRTLHVEGSGFFRSALEIGVPTGVQASLAVDGKAADLYNIISTTAQGIGILSTYRGAPRNFFAINGRASTINGNYAGYFNGNVNVTGSFSNASDEKLKQNIQKMDSALSKVLRIGVHTYHFKAEYDKYNFPKEKQYGVIAQELEKVMPELVKNVTDPTGGSSKLEYKSVNYIGLVPLLIAALQEEETKVEQLKEELATQKTLTLTLEERISRLESMINDRLNPDDNNSTAWIKQNTPNPVRALTFIQYFVPPGARAARILFTNAKGQQIKYYNISGAGSIEFNAGTLPSGSYNYSLITDGKTIATKQLIIAR